MTWIIRISQCAKVLSDAGVVVDDGFLDLSNEERDTLIRAGLKLWHRANDLNIEYEPLEWWSTFTHSMDGFNDALTELERRNRVREATRAAKREHTKKRRAEFNAIRSDLVLRLLDKGEPYVCDCPGCDEDHDLTIDHIVPISRGGSDDVSNLRFLCRAHNSMKGDKQ